MIANVDGVWRLALLRSVGGVVVLSHLNQAESTQTAEKLS